MTDTVRVPRAGFDRLLAFAEMVTRHYCDHSPMSQEGMMASEARAAMLAASPQGEKESDCVCVQRGDGPEGCGLCNETGVATHSASPQGEGSSGEWITHDGGPNPVPGKMVEVKLEIGDCFTSSDLSDDDTWRHIWGEANIIAYRVTEGVKP